MAAPYRTGTYSIQAIDDHFDVGRMTASRAVKKGQPG
jgi:transposase